MAPGSGHPAGCRPRLGHFLWRRCAIASGEPLEGGVELAVDERDEFGVDGLADELFGQGAAGGDELGDARIVPRRCSTPRVGLEPTTLRLTAGCSAN
jgi:hypothetical protein